MTNEEMARDWIANSAGNSYELIQSLTALLTQVQAEARLAALEEAKQIARRTPFRAHSNTDVDFHSGCVQTQERIIAALEHQVSVTGPK